MRDRGAAAEQAVERQSRGLAEDIELGHVDGAEDAHVGAAGIAHGHAVVEGTPDAVDVAGVATKKGRRVVA